MTGFAAAASLVATMGGLFAASLVADTIAHAGQTGGQTDHATRRHILKVSGRALEVTVLPPVLLLLSETGLWSTKTGLLLAIGVLVLTQVVLVLLGLRGSRTSVLRKIFYLLLQCAAIAAVIALKVLVH